MNVSFFLPHLDMLQAIGLRFNLIDSNVSNLFPVLPKGGPVIDGVKARYSLGDTVDLNCSSINSKPAADLFWSINGEPVRSLSSSATITSAVASSDVTIS